MSVTYPDLTNTTYPDSNQTFVQMMDITNADAPIVKQWHAAVQAQNFSLASTLWQQIPYATQKFLTAKILNTEFDTTVALERYFFDKYSPAYIVSVSQPAEQATDDYWFKIVKTVI